MTDPPITAVSTSALRYRGFRAFFVAASLSNGAGWMQSVAVPVLLFQMTGKTTWLGLSVVATMLPAVLLSAPAGVIGDRVDRRRMLICTQILQLCGAAALWTCHLAGLLTPGLILGLSVITGIGVGLQAPVWQAFVPSLVPRQAMVDAIRLNSIQFTIARVLGPAAAGVVVRELGFSWAFGINTLSYVLPIAVLVRLRTTRHEVDTAERVWQALRDGARWVRRQPAMMLMFFVAMFAAAVGQSLQALSAAISERVFGHPSQDNAILLTALGIGGLVAGVFNTRVVRRIDDLAGLISLTWLLYAVSALLMASTSIFAVGIAGFFLGGVAHVLNAVTVNSYLQTHAPEHLRGRIMGFYLLAVLGGVQTGGLILGLLGDWIGVRNSLLLDAAVVAAVGIFLRASGAMDRMLRQRRPQTERADGQLVAP